MNIYIFLRKTELWNIVPLEKCLDQHNRSILEDWNKLFSITWQQYRHRIKEKSQNTLCFPVLRTQEEILSKEDDDVVIPIDDDDWLRSDIEEHIRFEIRDYEILQWSQIFNSYDNRSIDRWGILNWQKFVNSSSDFCVRVGFLKTLSKEKLNEILMNHLKVRDIVSHCRKCYIPDTLSCYNYHIGSHSFLWQKKLKSANDLKPYIKPSKFIPKYAIWAEELINWLDNETMNLIRVIKI